MSDYGVYKYRFMSRQKVDRRERNRCQEIMKFLLQIFFICLVHVSTNYGFQDSGARVKRAFLPYRTGKKVAGQVSNALDHLLFFSGYDKRIRPNVSQNMVDLGCRLCVRKCESVQRV